MLNWFSFVFPGIVFLVTLLAVSSVIGKNRKRTRSSDGHFVPADQDLTCGTKDGHTHSQEGNVAEYGSRYIVHNDPETGYVILNGIKRKLTDCRNL